MLTDSGFIFSPYFHFSLALVRGARGILGENNDDREMMKLLYQTLRALCAPSLPDPLVRCIYECKAIAVNGEFPGPPPDEKLEESTIYALQYIASSPIEKLYTFNVTETVLKQLQQVSARYMKQFVGREFKSLEVLQTLC